MLFSSSTSFYSGLSEVTNTTLGSFWGFIVFIAGIVLTFFLINILLKALYPDRYKNEIEYIEK